MASVPWIQVQAAIDNQHKRCRNLSSGSESDSHTGQANIPEMTGTSPIASPSKYCSRAISMLGVLLSLN